MSNSNHRNLLHPQVTEQLDKAKGGVLFIDEAYEVSFFLRQLYCCVYVCVCV
jgi:hypothetical protein